MNTIETTIYAIESTNRGGITENYVISITTEGNEVDWATDRTELVNDFVEALEVGDATNITVDGDDITFNVDSSAHVVTSTIEKEAVAAYADTPVYYYDYAYGVVQRAAAGTYNDDTISSMIDNMADADLLDDLKVFNEEHGYNVGKYDSNFLDWLAMGIADGLEADGFVHEDCV